MLRRGCVRGSVAVPSIRSMRFVKCRRSLREAGRRCALDATLFSTATSKETVFSAALTALTPSAITRRSICSISRRSIPSASSPSDSVASRTSRAMSLILSGNSLMSILAVFMVIWGVGGASRELEVKLFVLISPHIFIYIHIGVLKYNSNEWCGASFLQD